MTNVSYLYDDAGRITQETSTGQTSVSEYDESGNRRSVIYPMGGRQLVTSFDALNRVTTIVETKPGVTGSRTTGYFYDAAGNRLLCIKPHGGSETTSYDALSRKVSLTTNSGSTTVSSTIYGYDLASNVTVINEANSGVPDRVVVNDYDRAYRLTQETTVTGANDKTEVAAFTYDKANNRTARTRTTVVPGNLTTVYSDTFTYGSAANGGNSNQLMLFHDGKRFVDVSYTYDANGNRQQRLEGSSATHTYAWDSRNRLIEVTSPDGTSHYGYDYRTRRVLRDESSAGGTSDVITFSGGTSIFERVSNTTVPTVEYIRGSDWGGGIGGILYTERGGSITHNAYNSRGDVIAKTDESGTITWQASYEAFGTRTEETGTNADRQRANTKEEDPTGLLNEGFRYRDLETGLFISRDPAGFVDGPNVYTYVRQNPWSSFDPHGLDQLSSAEAAKKHATEAAKINEDYNSRGPVLKFMSRLFGVHDRFHKMNDTAYDNAQKTGGDYSVPVDQQNAQIAEQGATSVVKTIIIANSIGGAIGELTEPVEDPAPAPETSQRDTVEYQQEQIEQQEGGTSSDKAPLKRLHSDETLEKDPTSSLESQRNRPTEEIVKSLEPGAEEPLRVKPDGTIMDGNTRQKVLEERGLDTNNLPRTEWNEPKMKEPWEE